MLMQPLSIQVLPLLDMWCHVSQCSELLASKGQWRVIGDGGLQAGLGACLYEAATHTCMTYTVEA